MGSDFDYFDCAFMSLVLALMNNLVVETVLWLIPHTSSRIGLVPTDLVNNRVKESESSFVWL